VPGKNPHTGQPQGELVRHEPGSNGSVHRGSDLKPRHIIRAIHLKTITDVGRLALPPDADGNGHRKSGAARRKRAAAAHAFITNAVTANQGIALDAAEGDPVARGQLLRLLHDMHEALQPTQDEAKGGGGPILPKFNRAHEAIGVKTYLSWINRLWAEALLLNGDDEGRARKPNTP
jgi:hypothetical protein